MWRDDPRGCKEKTCDMGVGQGGGAFVSKQRKMPWLPPPPRTPLVCLLVLVDSHQTFQFLQTERKTYYCIT